MPKDRAEVQDQYKIGGGSLNEFEFDRSKGEMEEQEHARPEGGHAEGLRGAAEPNAPQNVAERIRQVEEAAHEKVERLRAKRGAGRATKKGASKKGAKRDTGKGAKKSAKGAPKKGAAKSTGGRKSSGAKGASAARNVKRAAGAKKGGAKKSTKGGAQRGSAKKGSRARK